MSNFENGANLATENATGNIDIKCLGDSNMDSSCHNKLDTLKDNGKPLLDGSGQNIGGSIKGQNGKDSCEATDGSSNGQQGIGSSKATGEAHMNAPNTHGLLPVIMVIRVKEILSLYEDKLKHCMA